MALAHPDNLGLSPCEGQLPSNRNPVCSLHSSLPHDLPHLEDLDLFGESLSCPAQLHESLF